LNAAEGSANSSHCRKGTHILTFKSDRQSAAPASPRPDRSRLPRYLLTLVDAIIDVIGWTNIISYKLAPPFWQRENLTRVRFDCVWTTTNKAASRQLCSSSWSPPVSRRSPLLVRLFFSFDSTSRSPLLIVLIHFLPLPRASLSTLVFVSSRLSLAFIHRDNPLTFPSPFPLHCVRSLPFHSHL